MICSTDYVKKIVVMKKDGMAQHIKTLVALDTIDDSDLMNMA